MNVLVHAYNAGSTLHRVARAWWEVTLNGDAPVALPWAVLTGYVRLMTNARVLRVPITVAAAERDVRSWLARPQVVIVHPTERHADLFFGFLSAAGVGANLTTDAHIAALAVEHHAEVASTDADFKRVRGVRAHNPLLA